MMEWALLITAGLIAILSIGIKYRHIGALLFVDFLIMTGYQEILLDPINGIIYDSYKDIAPFYMYKYIIQASLTVVYIYFNAWALAGISVIIMGNLAYSVALSLYGIDAMYYESIMVTLSVSQLLVGFWGAMNGYWHNFDNLRHYSPFSNNKRV